LTLHKFVFVIEFGYLLPFSGFLTLMWLLLLLLVVLSLQPETETGLPLRTVSTVLGIG